MIVIALTAIVINRSGHRDHRFWRKPIFDHDEIGTLITMIQNE